MLNIQIQKKPKVPKQEKKKLKALKKHQKDVQKLKKKVLTTLDWCDVKEVTNNEVILQSGNGPQYHVVGVKVAPHDIFLDDDITLTMTINKLRLALNKLPFKIYWAFVTSPVNIDDYKVRLYNQQIQEDNLQIANMLSDDYNKAIDFETYNNELEFMFLIRNKDVRLLEKQLQDLYRETAQAGMNPKYLNKKDYLNYLAYIFENPLVNSVYFSRGIFHSLVEQY
ncbi:MAG: hypothetical protein Q4D29_12375, partial [Lachnospiraceae bacterium]|nr:hypothetical protein [Lachnospiraceae bacterium]